MSIPLTREAHEAGYQASAPALKKAAEKDQNIIMAIVPIRHGLQACSTAKELLDYVNGVSKTLDFASGVSHVDRSVLVEMLNDYLSGVYEHLDIDNPLKGRQR